MAPMNYLQNRNRLTDTEIRLGEGVGEGWTDWEFEVGSGKLLH